MSLTSCTSLVRALVCQPSGPGSIPAMSCSRVQRIPVNIGYTDTGIGISKFDTDVKAKQTCSYIILINCKMYRFCKQANTYCIKVLRKPKPKHKTTKQK
jgi:hypothetical protein